MSLTLNEYQSVALQTALFPLDDSGWDYLLSAIPEEVGEFSAIFAKAARNGRGRKLTTVEKGRAIKELGDILWNLALAARVLDVSLGAVAVDNIMKLESRRQRGRIEGSGDDR